MLELTIAELAGDHTIILSTHILPEVSQTCQRVVIINRGRVVAVDSPDNLTARLQGSQTLYVLLDSAGTDPAPALRALPGVTGISKVDEQGRAIGYEVDAGRGEDVRRALSGAIVNAGWGLLELRARQMSLEDIFLELTTEESDAAHDLGPDEAATDAEAIDG